MQVQFTIHVFECTHTSKMVIGFKKKRIRNRENLLNVMDNGSTSDSGAPHDIIKLLIRYPLLDSNETPP